MFSKNQFTLRISNPLCGEGVAPFVFQVILELVLDYKTGVLRGRVIAIPNTFFPCSVIDIACVIPLILLVSFTSLEKCNREMLKE